MTRIGKKEERRNQSPRKPRRPSPKTGPKKDNLPLGFREHANTVTGDAAQTCFIPKLK